MDRAPVDSHCSAAGSVNSPTHNDPAPPLLDFWGHSSEHVTPSSALRLATVNINGLPKDSLHVKNSTLREAIAHHHLDIIGLSEINLKWDRIYPSNRLKQRVSRWWENSHCNYAYNYHDLSKATYQPGGTALISLHSASHRVLPSSLSDPEGLGRWTSTLYSGKQGINLRIVQIYCPPLPCPLSHNSSYIQQHRHFLNSKVDDCPRNLFFQHLSRFLDSRMREQEQIILMGDLNHIADSPQILHFLHQHNLHNIHSSLHPSYSSDIPTFERGSKTIDAIFASLNLSAVRGGFLSFKSFPTDHRLLWCDIQFDDLFGSPRMTIIPHTRRRLKCEDPRSVQKFCATYSKLLTSHNLIDDAQRLQSSITGALTEAQQREFERIDRSRIKFMLMAEKKCRKFKTGGIEFSPKVQHQRDRINLWKHVLSKKNGGKASLSLLTRLEKKVGVSNTLSLPIIEVKKELSDAFAKYKSLIKPDKGATHRDEWFEDLAAAKAAANKTSLASELLQQRQREKQRQAFRSIKWSLQTSELDTSISQVTEMIEGREHIHSSKEDVETAIIKANDKKYRQTVDTPPMSTLLPDLGFLGNTAACSDILKGKYVPCTPIDQYTRALLNEFQRPPNIPQIPLTYTPTEYSTGWKKMREQTSSGLSGMHFGHHKACSQDVTLSRFEATMSAIPYSSGYSPSRYRNSVNTMLKKKHNKIAADQLRTILLLEADFNHLNKKLGRDLMWHAEKHQLIAPEQFGSRKHHSCIDQVLVKRLYYDSLRFSRTNGFLCSNDAKACYDRIVHSIASLAMQRVGMPLPPIECMLKTLQQMTHYIRTAHGISTQTYGCHNVDGKPVQGSGQGNGASPTIWTLISSPLLLMMRNLKFGAKFNTPLSKETINFVGCSFVDDTDLIHTSSTPGTPLRDFSQEMQNAINAWSSGLRATGGALVPEKSWIYPIEFTFNNKGHPIYKTLDQIQLNFTVNDANLQRCPLELVAATQARETLGVFLAPDGNEQAQINYLKTKVATWVERIRTNHISKHYAKLALSSTIFKTLEYSAPALTLSASQWASITTPLIKCGLHTNGVCSTFPKVIREGAHTHMALEFKNMHTIQEIMKLEKYLLFREHPGIVGQLIRLTEELLKIELGLPGDIFQADYTLFHQLATPSWIKSLWKFVFDTKLELSMRTLPLPETKVNDIFLISAFSAQGYCKSKLCTLNICRKYLQVTTLGDITTADGSMILPSIKAGRKPSHSTSTLHWPQQSSPDALSWKLWRSALRKTFETQGTISQCLRNSQWTSSPPRVFNWKYDTHSHSLFQRLPNGQWQLYRISIRRGRQPTTRNFHRTPTILRHIPPRSLPAPVIHTAPHRVRLGQTGSMVTPPPPLPRTTFESFVQHAFPSLHWILHHINGLENIDHIEHAIHNGNCAMISDGSYYASQSKAACAWVIGNEALHRTLTGAAPSVGPASCQSAYRGELAGLYGGLFTLKALCDYKNITSGRIIIGCDGLGAIKKIQAKPSLSTKHFDYLSAIHHLLADLSVRCQFIHVQGHQDDYLDLHQLSIVERMNIQADLLAKQAIENERNCGNPSELRLYKEYGPVLLPTTQSSYKFTSNFAKEMYKELTKTPTRSYWINKLNIPASATKYVAWESLGTAFSSLPTLRKIETVKWNTEFCATAKNLKRWKEQSHSTCPTCGVEEETTRHILQCPHPSARTTWNTSLNKLEAWLKQQLTAPDVTCIIIENLKAWRNGHLPVPYRGPHPHLRQAQIEQTHLGWDAFLKGFTTVTWSNAQHCFYLHLDSKRTGKRWLSELIKKLWAIAWDMWRFRNGILHSQSRTIPTNFTFLLTTAILQEMNHGHRLLPPRCNYLFSKPASSILKGSINGQKLWLATIWSARDLYSPADTICQSRNEIVKAYVDSWKKRVQK